MEQKSFSRRETKLALQLRQGPRSGMGVLNFAAKKAVRQMAEQNGVVPARLLFHSCLYVPKKTAAQWPHVKLKSRLTASGASALLSVISSLPSSSSCT